jgi:hypothetical protein
MINETDELCKVIIQTIESSLSFENIMDNIDFNSYLPRDKNNKRISSSDRYKDYTDKINAALEICEIEPIRTGDKLINSSITNLINCKKKRLGGRLKVKPEEEKRILEKNSFLLQSVLNRIQHKNTNGAIAPYLFWLKILYFNEIAICYSGLVKSSLSLGYSEESLLLIENACPKLKNIENTSACEDNITKLKIKDDIKIPLSHIINLYAFALFNKAEAERLLNEIDSSLKTFRRIINIYKCCNNTDINISKSNYNFALLREALILLDLGRSNDAIDLLEGLYHIDSFDFFSQEKNLEHASALIDQKEYVDAYRDLQIFRTEEWKDTFAHRKAEITILRLVNECKKNRTKDFKENAIGIQEIANELKKFKKTAENILLNSIRRKDGDNFKKVCIKIADYYSFSEIEEEKKKALSYFYLYLFECKIHTSGFINKVENWLKNGELKDLFNFYPDFHTVDQLDQVRNDDYYLERFFKTYIDKNSNIKEIGGSIENHIETIEKLKTRLSDICYQKDKDIELDRIKKDYDYFIETLNNSSPQTEESEIKEFIEAYYFRNGEKGMSIGNIKGQMFKNTEDFIKKIIGKTKLTLLNNSKEIQGTLSILRRWNSFTPTLSSTVNKSKGGGYFLRFYDNQKNIGIVIDPGYNFLENFFSQGFKIGDIDFVLVSHSHPDHTADLPSLLSLLHAKNGKLGNFYYHQKHNNKIVTLILSPGVFEHFNNIISHSDKELKDIIVVEIKNSDLKTVYKNKLGTLKIKAFGTAHEDLSQFQSLGFIINMENNSRKGSIGFTGDIKWKSNGSSYPEYIKHLNNCDIVCAHLGSIINIISDENFCTCYCDPKLVCGTIEQGCDQCEKNGFNNVNVSKNKVLNQTRKENHLYLAGIALLFKSLSTEQGNNLKLAVISEFGEELKHGLRIDLYKKFDSWFEKLFDKNIDKTRCLPGDIGLEIDVFTGKVLCHCCNRFVDRSEIEPVSYGKEEAICFICKECKSVLSSFQIDQILKDYCENGRQLESVNTANS